MEQDRAAENESFERRERQALSRDLVSSLPKRREMAFVVQSESGEIGSYPSC